MKSFRGKTAAITGAASGIGRALALELASRGCHVALADVNAVALARVAAEARKHRVTVSMRTVDVAVKAEVDAWAKAVVRRHGSVNLVFNNAGVGQCGSVQDTDMADYDWLLGINLWGVIHGTKAFLPLLKKTGDGHVVNISSMAGIFAQPGLSAYSASKFAVRGFTEALRQELDLEDCGVSATSVHPGGIRTGIFEAARWSDSVSEMLGMGSERTREQVQRILLTTPEKAAKTILAGVQRDARRVLVGPDAHAAAFLQRMLPTGYQRVQTALFRLARRFNS